jgi:hydrogenase nickel incorporation protein HypA/HybF
MHEYGLIESLLDRVGVEAKARRATKINRVWLKVGTLAGVDPELLAFAFETCKKDDHRTGCAEAALEITTVEATWRCSACGQAIASGEVLTCGACQNPAELVCGDEIVLERIELQVDESA